MWLSRATRTGLGLPALGGLILLFLLVNCGFQPLHGSRAGPVIAPFFGRNNPDDIFFLELGKIRSEYFHTDGLVLKNVPHRPLGGRIFEYL